MGMMVNTVTMWFYVKTTDKAKAVGDVVCAYNVFEDEHPKGKYSWVMEQREGDEDYWQIMGKYEDLKGDLTVVAAVYRAGDTVVLGEVDSDLAPNFLDPLLEKYGFDHIKWALTIPKK